MATASSELFALTDEQIVGLGTEDPTADTKETQALAEERTKNEKNPEAAANNTLQVPQWLADKMKDPWHGEEAQEFWNARQKAETENETYREAIGSAAEAKLWKEIYPGGVAEAKAAAERARELESIDAAFYRGDGAARKTLAEKMMRQDPAAFREMVQVGLALLGEEKPAASVQPTASVTPEVPPEVTRAYAEFEHAANAELDKSVGNTIARVMDEALPNLRLSGTRGGEAASGAAPLRERLAGAVREEVESALKNDRQLGEQVARVLSGKRFDAGARAQVVRLIDARAQELVPAAVRKIVGSWTQATVGARKSATTETTPRTEKSSAARSRRPNYRQMSDEEILSM